MTNRKRLPKPEFGKEKKKNDKEKGMTVGAVMDDPEGAPAKSPPRRTGMTNKK